MLRLLDRDLQGRRVADVGAPRAGGSHQGLVGLGEVRGVQRDEAHAVLLDPLDDLGHQGVLDLAVPLVAPPDQHVAALKSSSGRPWLGIVDRGFDDFPAVEFGQALGDRAVDVVGIDVLGAPFPRTRRPRSASRPRWRSAPSHRPGPKRRRRRSNRSTAAKRNAAWETPGVR